MSIKGRLAALQDRFNATPLGRSVTRYQHFRGSRLAGSVTFYGFLSVFPLLVLGFAVTLRVLGAEAVEQFEATIEGYVPGIADDLALPELRQQANQLGILGAVTLTITGLGWVDAQRASVRSMWGLPDRHETLVVRKGKDFLALLGLGALVVVSFLASSYVGGLASKSVELLGLDGSALADGGVRVLGALLALVTSILLMAYLISGLPRVRMSGRVLVIGALAGGVAFDASKHLLVGYVSNVATTSTYGAFGVPMALAVWIYVMARLIMAVAAWTAEESGASMVQPRFAEVVKLQAAAEPVESPPFEGARRGDEAPAEVDTARRRGRMQGVVIGAGAIVVLRRLFR